MQFHPFEVGFVGYSGSGKTTLISKLIDLYSRDFQIAYLKHDAHHFDMDHPGKDTHTMWSVGASEVMISDPSHFAHIKRRELSRAEVVNNSTSSDMLFIEGYKELSVPKIVVCDDQEKILDKIVRGEMPGLILGVVTNKARAQSKIGSYPCAHRDDVDTVWKWIQGCFEKKIKSIPVYGLVLCGGKSSRMKRDKALLDYHGMTQTRFTFELLSKRCKRTFISTRAGQLDGSDSEMLPQIHDELLDMGPIGGILTVMKKYPEAAWVVAACDLPYLTQEALEKLISARNPYKVATCFDGWEGKPEPLLCLYEPKSYLRLFQALGMRHHCPRDILMNSPIHLIRSTDSRLLTNVNTVSEFEETKEYFKKGNNEQFKNHPY